MNLGVWGLEDDIGYFEIVFFQHENRNSCCCDKNYSSEFSLLRAGSRL